MQSDRKGSSGTEGCRAQGSPAVLVDISFPPDQGTHTAQDQFCGLERWRSPKGRTESQGERRGAVKFRSIHELWHIWVRVKMVRHLSQKVCVVKNLTVSVASLQC